MDILTPYIYIYLYNHLHTVNALALIDGYIRRSENRKVKNFQS